MESDRAALRSNSVLPSAQIFSSRSPSSARSACCGRGRSSVLARPPQAAGAHPCAHLALEQDHLRSAREHSARHHRSHGGGAGRRGLGFGRALRRVLQAARRGQPPPGAEYADHPQAGGHAGARRRPRRRLYYLEVITDFLAREAWKRCRRSKRPAAISKASAGGLLANALEQSLAESEKGVLRAPRLCRNQSIRQPAGEGARPHRARAHLHGRAARSARYEQLRLRTERHAAAGGKHAARSAGRNRRREDARRALQLRRQLFCLCRIRIVRAALRQCRRNCRRRSRPDRALQFRSPSIAALATEADAEAQEQLAARRR